MVWPLSESLRRSWEMVSSAEVAIGSRRRTYGSSSGLALVNELEVRNRGVKVTGSVTESFRFD